ncbi:VWA domain-containing protein [bacterium]|nr:VWA domain-containing protein [bacterium]MBU1958814.1 VWA domain-containing protein [bacterium]
MTFVNPQFFWTMLLPLMVFTYFILTHQDRFVQIFDEKVLKRLSVHDDALPLVVRNLLLILAIFFMIVSMARPVVDHGDRTVQLEGLSVAIALDISGSMRSQDIYPNRLEFAKKKINQLLDTLPNDEVSLIAFAHASFVLAPFSSDKATLKLLVEGVDDKYINMSSTDFSALGNFSVELLEKKEPKILILFSDGGDKEDIAEFAQIVKENNIALYVVLVGSKEGAPVIGADGKPITQNGKIAITQRNDDLGEVALNNNGAFVVADTGNRDIQDLVTTIKAQHHSKNKGEVVIHDREELFYYPLGLGLVFLLVGFSSLPRWRFKAERD